VPATGAGSQQAEVEPVALPLIPFAAGLAVGTLVAYGAKDKAVRERIVQGTEAAYNWTKDSLAALWSQTPSLGRAREQAETAVAEVREAAGEAVGTAAEKTVDAAERLEEAAEELKRHD
jgi:hypothetical protein